MHPHLPPSFLRFLWTFTIFLGAPISFAEEPDPQYEACSRAFQCGGISSVFYPFWEGTRPDYCGLPGFQLRCEDNSAVIDMNSVPHRVLSVNQTNRSLVIARSDLWDDPCPENYINTTLNQSPFSNSSSNGNLALFYNCSGSIPGIPFPNKFSCPTGNGEQSDANYFAYGEYISIFRDAADDYECEHTIEVPVRNMSLETLKRAEELPTVLRWGFEVVYGIEATINHCLQCSASEGICGRRNSTSQDPVCFCRDRPSPDTCPASSRPGSTTLTRKLIIGFSGAAGAAIIVAFIFLFRYLRSFGKKAIENKNVEELLRNYGSITPKRYSYSDIKLMTNSFKKKLGQGGYGSVYKGKLHDGHLVAVKFLKELKGNGEEFINEVVSISRTSHVNIVTLLGFCFDGQKRALIYEFMPNGSLEKFIYDKKPLTSDRRLGWETLHQIATGIARGLEYLHRGCNTRILHFDIKPQNILLDEEFCPKISDFGLAKLCTRKESAISMLAARGTVGYIAPEVFSRHFGYVSHKSDVYSYGMMVLEMAGVRNNTDQVTGNTSDEYFPHWIYRHLNLSGHLALHGISTEKDDEIARKMVLVGLWCIQTNPSDRPSISKVLEMLEGDLESLQIPPKPFLSSPPRSPASSSTRSTSSKQSTIL